MTAILSYKSLLRRPENVFILDEEPSHDMNHRIPDYSNVGHSTVPSIPPPLPQPSTEPTPTEDITTSTVNIASISLSQSYYIML